MTGNQHYKPALLWLITAVGAVLFVTLQSFAYVNDYIRAHGAMPAVTFDPAMLWIVFAFYGAWIIPPLLALAGTRGSDRAMLILGGLLVVLNTLGGVFDGVRDGGHIIFLALLCIAFPGACATAASWRRVRAG
ncbi:hypothetical protein [Novosphingobium sp. BL-52-GroH]|uniref:hypothetical protein n=1 Tax=Novosphingobium sp. BL-52-GroH TaxID=3349877 RepID=UPI00384D7777